MTTKITVTACCSDEKEVLVTVRDGVETVDRLKLQNGDTIEQYAYDDRHVVVTEVDKE